MLSGRNEAALEALAGRLGGGATVELADLSQAGDVERLVEATKDLDILVLNAGLGGSPALERAASESGREEVDATIDVNLRAPMRMALAYAQHHIETGRPGHLAMIGSLSGIVATPNTWLYNATKFGLRGFALSLRQTLDGSPVGCSLIAPGFVREAGMFHNNNQDVPGYLRTKSPVDVAVAVAGAIEADKGEVLVAPAEFHVLSRVGGLAPGLSAAIQKRIGAADMVNTGDI